jgi:hypothetical protein
MIIVLKQTHSVGETNQQYLGKGRDWWKGKEKERKGNSMFDNTF